MQVFSWRKRVGVEPTIRAAKDRIAGFEGREGHRTPFASAVMQGHQTTKFMGHRQTGRFAFRWIDSFWVRMKMVQVE